MVAVLLAVLGAGAVTTGAAYAQGGAPAAPAPTGSTSQVSGPEGGPHGHDHHGPRP
ncbi:hypothetical protein [Microlunatus antarcticus]|uniref:Uncharacterized protein n=1 Tax=Microlunatus antarcticus TaxID=53388 RepID=A0A7W5JYA3_9ACTN|nr:hypothetical protein [Microlunatus antarcticus]MBB3328543.1 hypothetical protein [Microlunatus antarcticus]